MLRVCLCVFALVVWPVMGAEKVFDFAEAAVNQPPAGFRSAVAGEGTPGDWRVILEEAPTALVPLSPQAAAVSKRPVLAQLAQDPTDEHFPLLVYDRESFDDFTISTKFKTVRGTNEQMAGIAFRLQDEKNFYVLRASSLGNSFRFYKVVNGQRDILIGPEIPIPSGVWHEMSITCKGNKIDCSLNGKQVIPTMTDTSFIEGKFAFWTKSDSVSYFCDTKIQYTPREVPAQALVRQTLEKYPRVLGVQVFVLGSNPATTELIASNDSSQIGKAGGKVELDVISLGATYYGKEKDSVSVVLPLRDRNGDPIGAVRLLMRSFAGQTEQNAILRAAPIVKEMQSQVKSLRDLSG